MKCTNCGAEIQLKQKFCGECGAVKPELPPHFAETEQIFTELHEQYVRGNIDEDSYESELKKLIILDQIDEYWMLGADSGKWYRFDGQQWARDEPQIVETTKTDEPVIQGETIGEPSEPGGGSQKRFPIAVIAAAGLLLLCGMVFAGTLVIGVPLYLSLVDNGSHEKPPSVVEGSTRTESIPESEAVQQPTFDTPPPADKTTSPSSEQRREIDWQTVHVPEIGATFSLPADWPYEHDEHMLVIKDNYIEDGYFSVEWFPITEETDENEWEDLWLSDLYNLETQWSNFEYSETNHGKLIWTVGKDSEGDSILAAMSRLTTTEYVLYWMGWTPSENWDFWFNQFREVIDKNTKIE